MKATRAMITIARTRRITHTEKARITGSIIWNRVRDGKMPVTLKIAKIAVRIRPAENRLMLDLV
jgi:hypothetical protein